MGEGTKVERVTRMCILKRFPHRILIYKLTTNARISSLDVKKGELGWNGEVHRVLGELRSSRQ